MKSYKSNNPFGKHLTGPSCGHPLCMEGRCIQALRTQVKAKNVFATGLTFCPLPSKKAKKKVITIPPKPVVKLPSPHAVQLARMLALSSTPITPAVTSIVSTVVQPVPVV